MRSLLIKDTTREERRQIVHQALWAFTRRCGAHAASIVSSVPAATTEAADVSKASTSLISMA